MAEPVDLTVDNLTVKDTSSLNKVNINDGLLTVTGNSEVIFDTPFLKIAKDSQIYSSPSNQEILIHKQGKTSQREFGDGTGAVAYTKLVSLKGDTTLDIGGKDFNFSKNSSAKNQVNNNQVDGDKSYNVEVGGTHNLNFQAKNTEINSKTNENININYAAKNINLSKNNETANVNTKVSGQATINEEFGSKNRSQTISGDINISKSANNVNAQHKNKDFQFKQDSVNIVRNVTVSENQTYNNVCLGTKTFSATAKTSNINYKSEDHVFNSDNNTASFTKKANTFTIEESLGNKSRNQATNANVINKSSQNAIVNHSNLNFNRDTKTAGDWKSNTASKTYSYKVNSEQEFDYNVSSGMSQNLIRNSGMSINNECSTEQDYNTSVNSKGKLNISYSANEKVKNSSVKSETNNVNVDGNKTVSKKAGGTVQTEYTSKKLIQKLNTERQCVENNIPKIFYAQKSTASTRDIGLTDDNLVAVKYQNAVLTNVEYKASGLGVRNVSIRKDNKDLRELIKYKGIWYKLDVVGDTLQWQKYSDQDGMEMVSDSIEARSKK